MIQLPEGFDSMFRYITVVSQRAEQLIIGAKPRTESRHKKSTLIARDEVDAGLVTWRVLTPEELEAQRQAMVEQFRTEVGAETLPRQVRDVLPTGEAAEPSEEIDAGPEGEEDELARLQRLLGIRGPAESAPGLEADESDDVSEEAAAGASEAGSDEEATAYGDDGGFHSGDDDLDEDEDDTLDLDDESDEAEEEDGEDEIEDYGGDEDDEED